MSKMYTPTHVQVLVKRAKGLNIKGKNGTNDAFVMIALGKEKYQTSVKEKASDSVEWCEQCELTIPDNGNTAEIVLTALHRNFLGVDEFLGLVSIPLRDFDVYERPKTKWYSLKCKPGKNKTDYRGELEVRTSFTVKSNTDKKEIGSTSDLSSKPGKHKGSLQSLNKKAANFGGSLMSLGKTEKKNLKKLAKTVTHKVDKMGEKAKMRLSKTNLNSKAEEKSNLPNKLRTEDLDSSAFSDSFGLRTGSGRSNKNRDPGVESDDDDDEDDMFKFDALSHRSSGSSLNVGNNLGLVQSKVSTPMSGSLEQIGEGDIIATPPTPGGRGHGHVSTPGRNPYGKSRSSATLPVGNTSSELFKKSLHNYSKESLNITPAITPGSTPKSSRSFLMNGPVKPLRSATEPALDEWEAKLLGKKGVPFKRSETSTDAMSLVSQGSQNSFSAIPEKNSRNSSFRASNHSLGSSSNAKVQPPEIPARTNTLTPPQETPSGRKKIIPVGSDFESSPSPESPRNAATEQMNFNEADDAISHSNKNHKKNNKKSGSKDDSYEHERDEGKKSIGLKLKTSYSFKEREDRQEQKRLNNRDLQVSQESLSPSTRGGRHSRNPSDGGSNTSSGGGGGHQGLPPSGTRVVLGRETTPTPLNGTNGGGENEFEQGQRIPQDILERFEGRTREDLIEMVVNLQASVEKQAKKQSDLEDYIDSLLMKVISTAPDLLQKNNAMGQKYGKFVT